MALNGAAAAGDMDVCLWLTLKLNKEWSSPEIASLLHKDQLIEADQKFQQLDSPIKVS